MKKVLKKIGVLAALRIIKLFILRGTPKDKIKYLADARRYKKLYAQSGRNSFRIKKRFLLPIITEHRESSGAAKGDYFFQDLIAAREIFESNVTEHMDIGSKR